MKTTKRSLLITTIAVALIFISLFIIKTPIMKDIADKMETEKESIVKNNKEQYVVEDHTRADVEAETPALKSAYLREPNNDKKRRAYAKNLFERGDIWEAKKIIAPLATVKTTNLKDLELAAKVALLTQEFDQSEKLFKQLYELSKKDTESYKEAVEGLTLTYYQTNQFNKIKDLPTIENLEKPERADITRFLKKFIGKPYQIEWTSTDKIGHLPFTNDHFQPGELPHMDININGHKLDFLLDTGGDRLYVDKTVYKKIGVKPIQETKNKYAYTNGEYVDEILGVLGAVELNGVTIRNVPIHVGELRSRGQDIDGIITTQFLKNFLSTIDYENNEITLRERGATGKSQFQKSMEGRNLIKIPFFLSKNHLMFAKGNFNGYKGMNMFMDSGLAASQEAIITNETTALLGLKKEEISGTRYYAADANSIGLDGLHSPAGQVLGNVFVEDNPYWRLGFVW